MTSRVKSAKQSDEYVKVMSNFLSEIGVEAKNSTDGLEVANGAARQFSEYSQAPVLFLQREETRRNVTRPGLPQQFSVGSSIY